MSKKSVRRIRVTPRAYEDLKNIGRYTERTWGKTQRNHYLKCLDTCIKSLAKDPFLGRRRTDICEGYYSFAKGQHVVFYLIASETIDIIGIPHKNMDTINYFSEL